MSSDPRNSVTYTREYGGGNAQDIRFYMENDSYNFNQGSVNCSL